MTQPEWLIRPGRKTDGPLLTGFACADSTYPWQSEVEDFIRKGLLNDWALAPGAVDDDPRLLLGLTAQNELFLDVLMGCMTVCIASYSRLQAFNLSGLAESPQSSA